MPDEALARTMEDEAVLVLPRDDAHYYTYDEVEMNAVGVATVMTRDEAEAKGYTPTRAAPTP